MWYNATVINQNKSQNSWFNISNSPPEPILSNVFPAKKKKKKLAFLTVTLPQSQKWTMCIMKALILKSTCISTVSEWLHYRMKSEPLLLLPDLLIIKETH